MALYYAFLMVLAVVACAGARLPASRAAAPGGALRIGSVGTSCIISFGASSRVRVLVRAGRLRRSAYAFVDHQYASDPSKSRWEVLARGTGQCANLGLALLLLPVARTSIIAEAFGLAWEQLAVGPYLGRLRDIITIRRPRLVLVQSLHLVTHFPGGCFGDTHVLPDERPAQVERTVLR